MNNPTEEDEHDSSYDDIEHRQEKVEPNSSNTMATTTLIDDKWSCPACTYSNFAVAQKCTMCQQPRTTTMDAASADIYQLNASSGSSTQQEQAQQPIPATYIDSVEKWPCDQCTFLNYPRAARCTQCGSSRLIGTSRVSPVQPSIDTNTSERISPPPSIADSRLVAHRLRKWSCTRCTTDSKLQENVSTSNFSRSYQPSFSAFFYISRCPFSIELSLLFFRLPRNQKMYLVRQSSS